MGFLMNLLDVVTGRVQPILKPQIRFLRKPVRIQAYTVHLTLVYLVHIPILIWHERDWFAQDGTPTTRTFEHVPSEIGAEEAEEVGVEHLLRWVCNW